MPARRNVSASRRVDIIPACLDFAPQAPSWPGARLWRPGHLRFSGRWADGRDATSRRPAMTVTRVSMSSPLGISFHRNGRPAVNEACCHCEERQRRGNPPMVRTVRGIATALARLAMTTGSAQHRWDSWFLFSFHRHDRPTVNETCCHCEERQRRGNPPMVRTVMGIATTLKRLTMTTGSAQHRWDS